MDKKTDTRTIQETHKRRDTRVRKDAKRCGGGGVLFIVVMNSTTPNGLNTNQYLPGHNTSKNIELLCGIILRRERGQGNIHFPCSADHEQG